MSIACTLSFVSVILSCTYIVYSAGMKWNCTHGIMMKSNLMYFILSFLKEFLL